MTSNNINKALGFAIVAHKDQMYGDRPYIDHLIQTKNILLRFGYPETLCEDLHIAALLHDVLEDTDKNYLDIKKEFGLDVAEIVYAVTDEIGRTRKDRKLKTYPKIACNLNAIIIKLADRIANVENCIRFKNYELLDMYRKEQLEFELGLNLIQHITIADMWYHLIKIIDNNI